MSTPFELLIRVRYGECDAQNVVFNARYADYVDHAMTEYFRALFGGYEKLVAQGMDSQVVKLTIEWQSPARFDEVLRLQVQPERVGNTSYSLSVTMSEQGSGRSVVRAEVVYVLLSTRTWEKMSIPEEVRERLANGAPGYSVDQAGIGNKTGQP